MSFTEEQLTPDNYEERYTKMLSICIEKSATIVSLQEALSESAKRFNQLAEICYKKDELIGQLLRHPLKNGCDAGPAILPSNQTITKDES